MRLEEAVSLHVRQDFILKEKNLKRSENWWDMVWVSKFWCEQIEEIVKQVVWAGHQKNSWKLCVLA